MKRLGGSHKEKESVDISSFLSVIYLILTGLRIDAESIQSQAPMCPHQFCHFFNQYGWMYFTRSSSLRGDCIYGSAEIQYFPVSLRARCQFTSCREGLCRLYTLVIS